MTTLWWICDEMKNPKWEGTHKDHWVLLLPLHRTTQKTDHLTANVVQMLLEIWQAGVIISALGRLFQCSTTIWWRTFFYIGPNPPLAELCVVTLGHVTFTEERRTALPLQSLVRVCRPQRDFSSVSSYLCWTKQGTSATLHMSSLLDRSPCFCSFDCVVPGCLL